MANYQLGKTGAQIDAALDLAMNAAQKDGSYDTLTSGKAKNLQGRPSDAVGAEFFLRTAGGSADIGTGGATIKSIHGKTLVWNQLIQDKSNATSNYVTFTVDNTNHTINMNGTASESANATFTFFPDSISNGFRGENGHKYLILWESFSEGYYLITNNGGVSTGGNSANNASKNGLIFTVTDNTKGSGILLRVLSGETVNRTVYYPTLYDLTIMFGAGNEPTTVDAFKELFPLDYYAYNAGTLIHVNASSHNTIGFNQLADAFVVGKRWDDGSYISASSNNYAASPSKIKCLPSTAYCFTMPHRTNNTTSIYISYFDSNGDYLRRTSAVKITTGTYATFTTDADAYYMGFYTYRSSAEFTDAEVIDICVNLHWDGERDGENR